MKQRFRVSSPRVMHETIEGEVIIIDLASGAYYSVRATGAEIWQALEQGADEEAIVQTLTRRYVAPGAEIRAGVQTFLDTLAAEGLIEPWDGNADREAAAAATAGGDGNVDRAKAPFAEPMLEKHTDMQDLILLDPVHEVDARGWPHAAEDQK